MSHKDSRLCHEIHVSLPALVAGELDDDVRAAIEQHLAYCPGCQFEWREHEVVWRCLAECADVDPPEELHKRVLDAIEAYDRAHAR